MTGTATHLADAAACFADPSRAAMLIALMEGRALTAGELAFRAHISPQTASNHLKKLQAAGLVEFVPTPTRYRYYRISSPLVAQAIESLGLLIQPEKIKPPGHERIKPAICFARTCYDHLAGKLGVELANTLQKRGLLILDDAHFTVTDTGQAFFASLGIDINMLQQKKRQFAKPCLDWTEREFHVGGALGAELLTILLDNEWLTREKKGRIVHITETGKKWFLNLEH